MACQKAVEEFGRELAEHLRSSEAYSVLPGDLTNWTRGGCAILATALKRAIGRTASIWAVFDKEDGVITHVVVKVAGCYLDGDGAWTKTQLIEQRGGSRFVMLKPWDPANTESSITCPKGAVRDLVSLFGEWFPR